MKFILGMLLSVFSMQAFSADPVVRECYIQDGGLPTAVVIGQGSAGTSCDENNVCAVAAFFSHSSSGTEVTIMENINPFTAIGNEEEKIIGKLYYRGSEKQSQKFVVGEITVVCE